MSWKIALRAPLTEDLRPFLAALEHAQVPHRVAEEQGQQVLWVPEQVAEQVAALYASGMQIAPQQALVAQSAPKQSWLKHMQQAPITSLVLLISGIVALVSLMGTELPVVRWLNLQDFKVQGDYAYFVPLSDSLAAGQWWRLISPMFVHFWLPGMGPMHLLMNAMWFWILGRRIESQQGSLALLGLTLLFSVCSNMAQYYESGPSISGGLSGVLYGLLGYCWIFNRVAPTPAFVLPRGVVGFMLGWLLLCWSGALSGLFSTANGAHIGGLLAGCLLGLLFGGLTRARRSGA